MDNKKQTPKIDLMKLTPEQRDKLDDWNQSKQMLQHLSDIATLIQDIGTTLDDSEKSGDKSTQAMGALLTDMRESLSTLKDKEAPESPDFAKPVVEAVAKLEKAVSAAIKAIDVKPNVKVDAPQVNVEPPSISVDLKGVEKILKTDIPKAFKESIKGIPKPDKFDPKPLLDAWVGISEQLESLEIATRLKSEPGSIKVTNPDGTLVGTAGGSGLTDTELRATAVPVSGTVTANIGTVGTLATAAKQLADGHNVVVTSAPTTAVTNAGKIGRAHV